MEIQKTYGSGRPSQKPGITGIIAPLPGTLGATRTLAHHRRALRTHSGSVHGSVCSNSARVGRDADGKRRRQVFAEDFKWDSGDPGDGK